MNKEDMFNSLVENGLDFLFKAISEINDQPKYSVIHFYAAVELFVKARLMDEHWSLVVTKRQDPDKNKFFSGDFQSVSLEEAANRLKKIVGSGLSQAELDAFKDVAKHRNKMVHFFHEAHSEKENNKVRYGIVKEQLKAWYFLHQLLTVKWKDVFHSWNTEIAKLDTALRKLHEFLQVVFDNLSEEIKTQKQNGVHFEECPSCGFESQTHDTDNKIIYESSCLVCGLLEKSLCIECSDCNQLVIFKEEGVSDCESCGKHYEPENLAEILIDSDEVYISAKDGGDSCEGNCNDCDGYHTVVLTENEEWVCASCFEVFSSLESCDWCNELNTGDMSESYTFGCSHCEGMSSWDKS